MFYRPAIRTYVRSPGGQWVYWTSYGVFVVTYLALACFKNLGRRFPTNLILLFVLVINRKWRISQTVKNIQLFLLFLFQTLSMSYMVCILFLQWINLVDCLFDLDGYDISILYIGIDFSCCCNYKFCLFWCDFIFISNQIWFYLLFWSAICYFIGIDGFRICLYIHVFKSKSCIEKNQRNIW